MSYVKNTIEELQRDLADSRKMNSELSTKLVRIACRAPIMGSTGDYRQGQLDALEACKEVAEGLPPFPEGRWLSKEEEGKMHGEMKYYKDLYLAVCHELGIKGEDILPHEEMLITMIREHNK